VTALSLLYRDEALVVVDKPAGLIVHRGWAQDEVTVLSLLRNQLGHWVYPAHRLDRSTSGVLVFANSPEVAGQLGEAFADVRDGKSEHNRLFQRHFELERMALHAERVSFPHPSSGALLEVQAPLPGELQRVWSALLAANEASAAVHSPDPRHTV
jgi:23S rRNA-/tRNA-specific pseudouridylate synthase